MTLNLARRNLARRAGQRITVLIHPMCVVAGGLRPTAVNRTAKKPSLQDSDVDAIREEIREAGLRATLARIQTLVLLRQSSAPLTHADVAERLDNYGVDKATAFRNLNDLADAGLLRRSELGDHVWRFEAVDPQDADGNGHPHFICVDCGVVTCMDTVQLTAGSLRRSETVGQVTEILLRGHCNECR